MGSVGRGGGGIIHSAVPIKSESQYYVACSFTRPLALLPDGGFSIVSARVIIVLDEFYVSLQTGKHYSLKSTCSHASLVLPLKIQHPRTATRTTAEWNPWHGYAMDKSSALDANDKVSNCMTCAFQGPTLPPSRYLHTLKWCRESYPIIVPMQVRRHSQHLGGMQASPFEFGMPEKFILTCARSFRWAGVVVPRPALAPLRGLYHGPVSFPLPSEIRLSNTIRVVLVRVLCPWGCHTWMTIL